MQLTQSIPIIVPGAADPVGTGWVESLARPGGNVTGFTLLELSSFGKMLSILKQVAPSTVRVAVIHNPDNPNTALYLRLVDDFARSRRSGFPTSTFPALAAARNTLSRYGRRSSRQADGAAHDRCDTAPGDAHEIALKTGRLVGEARLRVDGP
jgi:ABC transporter substrate binding protein